MVYFQKWQICSVVNHVDVNYTGAPRDFCLECYVAHSLIFSSVDSR